jgi:hypothetical protein
MAKINGPIAITAQDLYTSTTVSEHPVGALGWDWQVGKAFRWTLNGTTAMVAGSLYQEAVRDTQFVNMAVGTAAVVGQQFLQITNGTTTVVPNQYVGGTINIYTAGTDPIGDEYTITGVSGTLTSGGALNVYLDRPLRYAVTTSATVNMLPSPWAGVIVAPTTQTGMIVGGAVYAIAASTSTVPQYGWIQTHGVFDVLSDSSTYAIGSDLGGPAANTAGAPTVYAAGTTHQRVGVARQAQASTHGITMFLQID